MASPTVTAATSYVMYVILRRDLQTKLNWPLGAVCTQTAHAASAAMWIFRDDPNTEAYTRDLDRMHKVTLGLTGASWTSDRDSKRMGPPMRSHSLRIAYQVDSEEEIRKVADKLSTRHVDHKVWIEDGFPVCIALKPYPKEEVKNVLKGLKLF